MPAGRRTSSFGFWRNGCRKRSARTSSSKTGPAPAAISRQKPSCARRRTATRCSELGSPNFINATLNPDPNFDLIRDIVPVAGIGRNPFVMVVNPDFPAKTVPEFIAYAKANPGKINMTSTGTGNLTHFGGELSR